MFIKQNSNESIPYSEDNTEMNSNASTLANTQWFQIEQRNHTLQRHKKLKQYYEMQYQVSLEQFDPSRNRLQQLEQQENLLFQLLKLKCQTGEIMLQTEKILYNVKENACSVMKQHMEQQMKQFASSYCFVVASGDQWHMIPYSDKQKNYFWVDRNGYTFICFKLQQKAILLDLPQQQMQQQQFNKQDCDDQEEQNNYDNDNDNDDSKISSEKSIIFPSLSKMNSSDNTSTRPNSRQKKITFNIQSSKNSRQNSVSKFSGNVAQAVSRTRNNSRHKILRISTKQITYEKNFSQQLQEQLVKLHQNEQQQQEQQQQQQQQQQQKQQQKSVQQQKRGHRKSKTTLINCEQFNKQKFQDFVGQKSQKYLNERIQSLKEKEQTIEKLNRQNSKRLSFFIQHNPTLQLPNKIQQQEITKLLKNYLNFEGHPKKLQNLQYYSAYAICEAVMKAYQGQGIQPKMVLVKGTPISEAFWDFTCKSQISVQNYDLIANKGIIVCI